jgi:hypothetical protein
MAEPPLRRKGLPAIRLRPVVPGPGAAAAVPASPDSAAAADAPRGGADAQTPPAATPSRPPRRERVARALDLLQEGRGDRAILQALREEFSLTARRARGDLDAAYAELAALAARRGTRDLLHRAVDQREALLARALAKDDCRTALAVLESRDKLLGLADRETFAGDAAAESFLRLAELARREEDETAATGEAP